MGTTTYAMEPIRRRIALTMIGLLIARPLRAHGIHAAFTDISVQGDALVITHRMFKQDLALLITARTNAQVDLAGGAAFDDAVESYLHDVFVLTDQSGARLPMRGVRVEIGGEMVTVTQKIPGGAALNVLKVSDQILTETNPDQVNTVNLTRRDKTKTAVFTVNDTARFLSE